MEFDVAGVHRGPPRLDLRHLEDVVDQRQEVLSAPPDRLEPLPLLRREARVAEQELREAEDGVHRRADLVGHAREERALGPAGRLRRLPLRLELDGAARHELLEVIAVAGQLLLRLLPLGDVPVDGQEDATPVQDGLADGGLHGEDGAVLADVDELALDHAGRVELVEEAVPRDPGRRRVPGPVEDLDRAADQLLARVAVHGAEARVAVQDHERLRVEDDDPVGAPVVERPEARLVPVELLEDTLPLGVDPHPVEGRADLPPEARQVLLLARRQASRPLFRRRAGADRADPGVEQRERDRDQRPESGPGGQVRVGARVLADVLDLDDGGAGGDLLREAVPAERDAREPPFRRRLDAFAPGVRRDDPLAALRREVEPAPPEPQDGTDLLRRRVRDLVRRVGRREAARQPKERARVRLPLGRRRLGPLALGDFAEVDAQPVGGRVDPVLEPEPPGLVALLDDDDLLRPGRLLVGAVERLTDPFRVLGPDVPADQVRRRLAAEEARSPRVDVGVPPVPVERDEAVADALEDPRELVAGRLRLGEEPLPLDDRVARPRHVARDAEDPDQPPAGAVDGGLHGFHRAGRTVRARDLLDEGHRPARLHGFPIPASEGGGRPGVEEVPVRPADDRARRGAHEPLEPGVRLQVGALRVLEPHRLRDRVEEGLQEDALLLDPHLLEAARADLGERADDGERLSPLPPHDDPSPILQPEPAAVGVPEPVLRPVGPSGQDGLDLGRDRPEVVRVDAVEPLLVLRSQGRETRQLERRLVDGQRLGRDVDLPRAEPGRLERGREPRLEVRLLGPQTSFVLSRRLDELEVEVLQEPALAEDADEVARPVHDRDVPNSPLPHQRHGLAHGAAGREGEERRGHRLGERPGGDRLPLEEKARKVPLRDDADGAPPVHDEHEAAPCAPHPGDGRREERLPRERRDVPVEDRFEPSEPADDLAPQVPAQVGLADDAARLSAGVDDDEVTDPAPPQLRPGGPEAAVRGDRRDRGGHHLPDRRREPDPHVREPRHVPLGQDPDGTALPGDDRAGVPARDHAGEDVPQRVPGMDQHDARAHHVGDGERRDRPDGRPPQGSGRAVRTHRDPLIAVLRTPAPRLAGGIRGYLPSARRARSVSFSNASASRRRAAAEAGSVS